MRLFLSEFQLGADQDSLNHVFCRSFGETHRDLEYVATAKAGSSTAKVISG